MYRPIKQLPGCNPRWDKGVDKKPGCSIPRPAPEMVYPNVYLRSLEVCCIYLDQRSQKPERALLVLRPENAADTP